MRKINPSQSGVALLMVLGVLALLSILGVTFSTNMRLMERTTRDFVYEQMARDIAEAGIDRAIAGLKEDARNKFTYTGLGEIEEIIEDIDERGNLDGKYEVTVVDTASQVNINTANKSLLECIPGIGTDKAQAIINRRNKMPNKMFLTKKSICLAEKDTDGADVGEKLFDEIKNLITAHGYIDPNVLDKDSNVVPAGQGRSAININSAIYNLNSNESRKYLKDMLANMFDAVYDIGNSLATNIVSALKTYGESPEFPFQSWKEFLDVIDQVKNIGPERLDKINRAFNPNRPKPTDKKENPTYTTEFCFHSGGIYEITSTGTLTNNRGEVVAQKTINATVKIFDLWNQTTTQQFWGEDVNSNYKLDTNEDLNANGILDPGFLNVTGADNCPVRSDDNWNGTATTDVNYNKNTEYYTIPGSLKIGYWDDFTTRSDIAPWVEQKKSAAEKTTFNGVADMPQYGEIILGELEQNDVNWQFDNCSETIEAIETGDPPNLGWHSPNWDYSNGFETGWFFFRATKSGEDMCTQFYYAEERDAKGKKLYPISPICSPFLYTINQDATLEWESGWEQTQFVKTKTYRVIQYGNFVELYMISGDNTTQFGVPNVGDPKVADTFDRNISAGWIKLWTRTRKLNDPDQEGGTHWDNLRIISDTGNYTSPSSNQAYNPLNLPDPVEWGMVWGTVTRPDSVLNPLDVDIKIEIPPGSTEMDFTSGAQISIDNSISIQYKLNFYSNYSDTNKYLKTPVLEDVWITYLPKTKILYWQGGAVGAD